MPLQPTIKFAMRPDRVFITIDIQDLVKPEVNLTPEGKFEFKVSFPQPPPPWIAPFLSLHRTSRCRVTNAKFAPPIPDRRPPPPTARNTTATTSCSRALTLR